MQHSSIFFLFGVMVMVPTTTFARQLHVPEDFPSIQDAIDASDAGDTVVVAPGLYDGAVRFNGKALTVISSEGPEVTFLEGFLSPDGLPAVAFQNGEGPDAVIDGFTITNQLFVFTGGGIYACAASPTIRGNIITDNTAAVEGGGVTLCAGSHAILENNQILGNSTGAGFAGGVYILESNPYLEGNLIADNSDDGVFIQEPSPLLVGNSIVGNADDGVVAVNNSAPALTNCLMWDNMDRDLTTDTDEDASSILADHSLWNASEAFGNITAIESIHDDPLLRGDYRLTAASPARNAGDNVAVGVATDIDGTSRILEGRVDIGAFEFDPNAPTATPSPSPTPGPVTCGAMLRK